MSTDAASQLIELEATMRWLLANASTRAEVASLVAPSSPSADYLTGFAAGAEAGQVQALAMVLSALTGKSLLQIIQDAATMAAIDRQFPFDLQLYTDDYAA